MANNGSDVPPTDILAVINWYRENELGREQSLQMARYAFSRMLQSEGIEPVEEVRVLQLLERSSGLPKAWSSLMDRHPSARERPESLLTTIILCDSLARLHQNLPSARARAEAKLKRLDQNAADLQEFFVSELSGISAAPFDNEPGKTQALLLLIQKSVHALAYMRKYVEGRLDSKLSYTDYVFPQKQSRGKLSLSFSGEMCKLLSNRFGMPCYEFVKQAAHAVYPTEQIGDIESKFKAELSASKPFPSHVEEEVRRIIARGVGNLSRSKAH